MGGKFGVDNIKKILAFIIELANVVDQFLKNPGMGTFKKLGLAFQLHDEISGLLSLNPKGVKDEYGELDEADKLAIHQYVHLKLHLADGSAEPKVQAALDILEHGGDFLAKFLDFIKVLKG